MYNPGHLPQHESRFWEVRKVFTIMGFVRLFEDYAGGRATFRALHFREEISSSPESRRTALKGLKLRLQQELLRQTTVFLGAKNVKSCALTPPIRATF